MHIQQALYIYMNMYRSEMQNENSKKAQNPYELLFC